MNIGVTDLAHTKKIQFFGVLITQTKSTSTFVTLIDFFALVHKNAIFKKTKNNVYLGYISKCCQNQTRIQFGRPNIIQFGRPNRIQLTVQTRIQFGRPNWIQLDVQTKIQFGQSQKTLL